LRRAGIVQVQSRSDEGEARKSLREVADLPLPVRIVLFRVKSDIVGKRQQTFEKRTRIGITVLQCVVVGKSEATREKCAFTGP
jgi:hypothetical protein